MNVSNVKSLGCCKNFFSKDKGTITETFTHQWPDTGPPSSELKVLGTEVVIPFMHLYNFMNKNEKHELKSQYAQLCKYKL